MAEALLPSAAILRLLLPLTTIFYLAATVRAAPPAAVLPPPVVSAATTDAGGGKSRPAAGLLSLRAVDPDEPDALLKFTLTELQRAKVEGREMDECHGLELASIDSRDEKVENGVKHHLKLKIQPTLIITPACTHRNVTASINSHPQPEVCEAEVWENDDDEGHHQMALLRSSCLQVEELGN